MSKYYDQRDQAIDVYRKALGDNTILDVLFLSHAHADHANGLVNLLSGLKVDTIVMPLLNDEDRLIAFAQTAAEDPVSARDDFYLAFIADPVTTLATRFRPRLIILVKRNDTNGGAPGRDGSAPDPRGEDGPISELHGTTWRLIGEGDVQKRKIDATKGYKEESVVVATVPDTMAIVIDAADTRGTWLLAPYADRGVEAGQAAFLAELVNDGGCDLNDIKDADYTRRALENIMNLQSLVRAYRKLSKNLNSTSMCLYSGHFENKHTLEEVTIDVIRHKSIKDKLHRSFQYRHCNARIAWFGTGDASFRNNPEVADLARHYGVHLTKIETMTLPHHGSDLNVNFRLIYEVKPEVCVASSASFCNWKHPGDEIRNTLAFFGITLEQVTDDVETQKEEIHQ